MSLHERLLFINDFISIGISCIYLPTKYRTSIILLGGAVGASQTVLSRCMFFLHSVDTAAREGEVYARLRREPLIFVIVRLFAKMIVRLLKFTRGSRINRKKNRSR